MQPSTNQGTDEDSRDVSARATGAILKASPDKWFTLSDDDMSDMVVVPGTRGVPGPDECIHLVERLNRVCKTMRSAHFYARLAAGDGKPRFYAVHEVMYGGLIAAHEGAATAGPCGAMHPQEGAE